jgi:benzoyl-CoA reductase/2-hydroxyglutaryl-CoA dehydratase subunit BcrC/BadD/HgdB
MAPVNSLPPGAGVGLTTTIPVEVVLAAGLAPVDLNNLFISDPEARLRVSAAEAAGFPRTICSWIKGLYGTLQSHPEIAAVIVACQGDCSYTQALGEILEAAGREIIHFKFPYPRERLRPLRAKLRRLDRLTWESGQVRGEENFLYLISGSDFQSAPEAYEQKVAAFLKVAEGRPPYAGKVRLGFAGIPPIFTDLWDYLEELGAQVVFNEFPRQFSMPEPGLDLVEQYFRYTYPYDIAGRLADLQEAAATRRLDGLVHYTQSFCFRQMFDLSIRERLGVPVLTIEGDRPGPLDARTRMRLEAFVDVLRP